jgi:hypothetical protein
MSRVALPAGPSLARTGLINAGRLAARSDRELGRIKPGGVTDGTAAQTSICWRLKPGLSRAEPMAGGRNGWDDALYGKRCTD